MGNSESTPQKEVPWYHNANAARLANRSHFENGIMVFKSQNKELFPPSPHLTTRAPAHHRLRVAVRIRPLNDKETKRGEFSVVSVGVVGDQIGVWVHAAGLRLDGRHMFLEHHGYAVDAAFSPQQSSEDVYTHAVAPLVSHVESGGNANVMMFGPTGTGKTFTMTALTQHITKGLGTGVRLQCVEISGNVVRDLISEGAPIMSLRSGAEESVFDTATAVVPESHVALSAAMQGAAAQRATFETGVHATSSRSHVIWRLSKPHEGGSLTLVDLAGSEWAQDQASHTAERRSESKTINSSLLTLKQCLRSIRQGSAHMPYRESTLTAALHATLTDPQGISLLIATVGPGSADTHHSMHTLRSVRAEEADGMGGDVLITSNVPGLAGDPSEASGESQIPAVRTERPTDPAQWTPSEVCEWFVEACERILLALKANAPAKEHPLEEEVEIMLDAAALVARRVVDVNPRLNLGLVAEPGTEAVVVKQIQRHSILGSLKDARLKPGARLIGVQLLRNSVAEIHEQDPSKIIAALRQSMEQLKDAVLSERLAEMRGDGQPRAAQTPDLLALRAWVAGESTNAPPPGSNPEIAAGVLSGQGAASVPTPHPPSSDTTAVVLLFRCDNGSGGGVRAGLGDMPRVPRVFTGESRTGEVWGGKELMRCGEEWFVGVCGGRKDLGRAIFNELQTLRQSAAAEKQ